MTGFYNTLRFLTWRIFVYLKETVVHELSRLLPASKPVELLDSKRNRFNLSSKHVAAEVTFFFICAFLVVLIILFLKCPKDEEDEYEEEEDEEVEADVEEITLDSSYKSYELSMIESSSNQVFSNSQLCIQSKDENFVRCDCGDSSLIPQIQGNYSRSNFSHPEGCSKTSLGRVRGIPKYFSEQQQPQIKVNPTKHRCRRTAKKPHFMKMTDREWFVRRTRSGQIYGKYPI